MTSELRQSSTSPRSGRVKRAGFLCWTVLRYRGSGEMDWSTEHYTRRGAERALVAWLADATIKGRVP